MIAIHDLDLNRGADQLDSLSLKIDDGEIYFLLNRFGLDFLFHVLDGLRQADAGEVRFNGGIAPGRGSAGIVACIDRVAEVADFETEARLGDWIDFLCAAGGLDRASIFKTLLVCNFHESHLKRKVRDVAPDVFMQVYLAVSLADDRRNLIINDFIHRADKGFELKFNKLLLQKKAQGCAILYLGSDIFYASDIADRVGFVKNGRLLFEADATDLKEMDIKDLYLKFLN
jgi:ABC-type multidrug transport system ATPase subunit